MLINSRRERPKIASHNEHAIFKWAERYTTLEKSLLKLFILVWEATHINQYRPRVLDRGWAFYCNLPPPSAFQKRSDLLFAEKTSSEINFLKILPLGLLGIESTKQTPPARCLYPMSSVAMYSLTLSSESDWQFRTTKAFGASASLYLTPMTAASMMFG